jgi:RHS repeat-associated protein
VTEFAYEELGKLYTVTQPLVELAGGGTARPVTRYTYDEDRNRILQTDANHHNVEMTYDNMNRLEKTIQHLADRDLTTTIEQYDGNGNVKSLLDANGQRVRSEYDDLNRLKHREYEAAPGVTPALWRQTTAIDYHYDGNGNLTQADETVASGTDPPVTLSTIRHYDDFDRLTSEDTPAPSGTRTVGYGYWKNGTRKLVTDPAGIQTHYDYDAQNRLRTVSGGSGSTSYGYYADGLLDTITYPNGVVAKHGYDNADRLTSLVNSKSGATVSSYAYHYTDNGNRDQQIEVNGGLTETTTYGYDALNRLTTVSYPDVGAGLGPARVAAYGYDLVGNRATETITDAGTLVSSKTGVFDFANRLTTLTDSVDPSKSATFAYDANGNQIAKTVAGVRTDYRFDVRDKLIEADQGASVFGRYAYDFDGRRTFKTGEVGVTSADNVRSYVYDQTSILTEYNADDAQVSKYDYGSDRLISLTSSYEGRRYYLFDGLRSVTNLTDDSGATAASYHLDAWGNFRNPDELNASQNRFAFTGYQWDIATGLYNAKARFYDPLYGRFTSQDSELGNVDDPPSLHRYFYGNDNPTRYVDLTGHAGKEPDYYGEALLQEQKRMLRGMFVQMGKDFGINIPYIERSLSGISPRDNLGATAREKLNEKGGLDAFEKHRKEGVMVGLSYGFGTHIANDINTIIPIMDIAATFDSEKAPELRWSAGLMATGKVLLLAAAAKGALGTQGVVVGEGEASLAVRTPPAEAVRPAPELAPPSEVPAPSSGSIRIQPAARMSVAPDAAAGGSSEARYVYDAQAARYRDLETGRFVAQRDLPYPKESFASSETGTVSEGTVVERLGRPSGRYASEPGASVSERGMPPGSEALPRHRYVVVRPQKAQIGPAAGVPAFAAEGGAKQYLFDRPIDELLRQGILRETK